MNNDFSYSISEGDGNFDYWISQPFIPEYLKADLLNANILIVPMLGFRDSVLPNFPVGTESIMTFFRENLPNDVSIDICISDEDYNELGLYSRWNRYGHFVVKEAFLPIFISVFSTFLTQRLLNDEETTQSATVKTENQMGNNTNNINSNNKLNLNVNININPPVQNDKLDKPQKPASKIIPVKFHEKPNIEFTVTVVDSSNVKSTKFHYSGPQEGIPAATEAMKKLVSDDNKRD